MTTPQSALLSRSAAFRHSAEVLQPGGWSPEQKLRVLRQLKYDLGQLQVAMDTDPAPTSLPV